MKKLLLFLNLSLAIGVVTAQHGITIQNKTFNLVDLVDTPSVDTIGYLADSSDVFYDVTVRVYRSAYVPLIDSTITVIDTFPFHYVLGKELDNNIFNSIWGNEAVFARAEYDLYFESAVEANLVKLNPVLIKTRGKGYLAFTKDAYLADYVGYWRLTYNGVSRTFRIKPDASIVEVRFNAVDTSFVPKPSGLTGSVQLYHGYRRIALNNLIPGDTPLKLSSNSERSGFFVRREKAVKMVYMKPSIQTVPYVE